MSKRRSIAVWTLIGVATLLTLITSLTVWTKRQLLDTDNWTHTSAQLLANPEIRSALSLRINDAIFQQVDLDAALRKNLPAQAKSATPLIAAAIQDGGQRAIEAFLSTSAGQRLWEEVNRRGQKALVRALEGKTVGPVSTDSNGDVVLDLKPLIDRVSGRLGVADEIKKHVPSATDEIVILHSDQLKTAQDAIWLLRVLSVALAIVVVLLYAIAIYIAHGRRRIVLEATGGSLALVGLLVLVIRRVVGNIIVNSLVKTDSDKAAATAAWQIATDLLHDLAIALIAYGILFIVAGWLAGPSRWATWVRREVAPLFRHSPWVIHGAGLAVFLILIAWGPTNATREFLGVLVLAVLFFLALELFRRMTLREFPAHPAPKPPTQEPPPPPPVTATLPG
jgi:hypothetical protein